MTSHDLRILIVAENPLARMGLAALLASLPNMIVVGQTTGDNDIAESVAAYTPDLIVWDMGWEPQSAFDAIENVLESDIAVLALLTDETAATSVMSTGVQGLLLADVDPDSLAAAIVAVGQGLVVIDPELRGVLQISNESALGNLVETLTAREIEVLQLLAEGLPNKTIAKRLNISDHTVKFHVNAILRKLDAQSRTEAVVRASRLGLILL